MSCSRHPEASWSRKSSPTVKSRAGSRARGVLADTKARGGTEASSMLVKLMREKGELSVAGVGAKELIQARFVAGLKLLLEAKRFLEPDLEASDWYTPTFERLPRAYLLGVAGWDDFFPDLRAY